jgi:hypothetical protein
MVKQGARPKSKGKGPKELEMSAIKVKLDSHEVTEYRHCNGAGVADYIFVNTDASASVEFAGQTFYFSYQNGHGFKGNDYNCPSNKFVVYQDNGFVEAISKLGENDDDEDYLDVLDRFDISASVKDARALYLALCEATPTLSDFGLSDDCADYVYTNDAGEEITAREYLQLEGEAGGISPKS